MSCKKINLLRWKMITTVFLATAAIFLLTFFIIRGTALFYYTRQADRMTELISEEGEVPEGRSDISQEAPFSTRYFIVYENTVNMEHVASIEQIEAFEMAGKAKETGKETGYVDCYRYRVTENFIVFLDCTETLNFIGFLTNILGAIALTFPFVILIVFFFISARVIKPFKESSELQKQFIVDAGHELKTPLAIIAANASVLEYTSGENEYLNNIQEQTATMGTLVDNLLTLVKTEHSETEFATYNFSELINKYINDFRVVFEQKNIALQTNIAEAVSAYGTHLPMAVSCLFENASKYTPEGGDVKITLSATNKHAVFQIYNTAVLDKKLNLAKLFARFYRPDDSRNSATGGHGIGLSTALSIAERSGGSLTAKRKDAGIVFILTLKKQ